MDFHPLSRFHSPCLLSSSTYLIIWRTPSTKILHEFSLTSAPFNWYNPCMILKTICWIKNFYDKILFLSIKCHLECINSPPQKGFDTSLSWQGRGIHAYKKETTPKRKHALSVYMVQLLANVHGVYYVEVSMIPLLWGYRIMILSPSLISSPCIVFSKFFSIFHMGRQSP